MRRIRSVGLCVVLVLVLAGLFAGGALAKKVAPITGPFKVTSSTGEAVLRAQTIGNVKCKRGEDAGEVTGPKVATDTVTFLECEGFGFKCKSEGEPAGTIKTALLDTELGWVSKGTGEVGLDFKPAVGTYLAEFDCEGIKAKVKGSVIGLMGPVDQMGETETETFTGSGFTQTIQAFEGGLKDTLITETNTTGSEELESAQIVDGTTTNDEIEVKGKKGKVEFKKDPAEINTESGTPEYGRCQVHKKGHYKDSNCTELDKNSKGKYVGGYEFEPV